jgi:hypothetical protein
MRIAVVALVALVFASTAVAVVNLTAIDTRFGNHAAFVRVVVDFTDGDLRPNDVMLLDPRVRDGETRLEIRHLRVRTEAPPESGQGVRVTSTQGTNRIVFRLRAAANRFKYVSYETLSSPERLVIDLWKDDPPRPAATIRNDGCLRLDSYSVGARARASGVALQRLFENALVLRVRNSGGAIVGERPLITDQQGRWSGNFPYTVARAQRGTLEAVVGSAKDGALDCLVQVPVNLRP